MYINMMLPQAAFSCVLMFADSSNNFIDTEKTHSTSIPAQPWLPIPPTPTRTRLKRYSPTAPVPDIFHKYLADPLDVVVVGQDFHISGHYKSMEEFHEGVYTRVAASLKVETIRVEVLRVIGGGHSAWAAVELVCHSYVEVW